MVRTALLLGLIGCVPPIPPEGSPCRSDQECPTSQTCERGVCRHGSFDEPDAAIVHDSAPVDTAIDAAPRPCTTDGLTCNTTAVAFMCGTTCFAKCGQGVVQATAETACEAWSGRLAEVPDATTNTCLAAHAGTDSWFGLTQSPAATTPDAGWTWNGVDPVTFISWAAGKPDDAGGGENGAEQCAAIASNGTWDDMSCSAFAFPFTCSR
jgi:hypothetical protein